MTHTNTEGVTGRRSIKSSKNKHNDVHGFKGHDLLTGTIEFVNSNQPNGEIICQDFLLHVRLQDFIRTALSPPLQGLWCAHLKLLDFGAF